MKINADIKRIVTDNIHADIGILTMQSRLSKDTTERKNILIEKLNLLYSMDIINTELYFEYMETIKSF